MNRWHALIEFGLRDEPQFNDGEKQWLAAGLAERVEWELAEYIKAREYVAELKAKLIEELRCKPSSN